jgi:hypothetical protein
MISSMAHLNLLSSSAKRGLAAFVALTSISCSGEKTSVPGAQEAMFPAAVSKENMTVVAKQPNSSMLMAREIKVAQSSPQGADGETPTSNPADTNSRENPPKVKPSNPENGSNRELSEKCNASTGEEKRRNKYCQAWALIKAYPEHLAPSFDGEYLIWKKDKSGEQPAPMRFSDGLENKTTDQLVNRPSVRDMFHWRYYFGAGGLGFRKGADAEHVQNVERNPDPGRVRNEEFFEKMYGTCNRKPGEVCGNVICNPKGKTAAVPWVGGETMRATTINGVDRKLREVSDELARLVERQPDLSKYLSPSGGSLVQRCIAGTSRLSVHSFGIAFDISPKYGSYWQYGLGKITEAEFEKQKKPLVYNNKIPLQIVKVFEDHGFIWGGNWYHFDGMHFEYRPEFKKLDEIMAGRGA